MKEKTLTKTEVKEKRREQNKQWMMLSRSNWSAEDLNPRHTQYYHSQLPQLKIEWDRFKASMKTELSVTFRVSCSCSNALKQVISYTLENELNRLRGHFATNKHGDVIGGSIIHSVSWMPYSYELSISNKELGEEKGFEKLSKFLLREVSLGHIVRQELVSMIPAALLEIQSHHLILDLCAAPGSKTEQLLGYMVRAAGGSGARSLPTGVLVANDVDSKRIHTLCSRLSASHKSHLVITNADATRFSQSFERCDREIFDRIACDVPCSGDGTFRKSPHFWRLFRPRMGMEFHTLQVDILSEAIKVCKVGGQVVYSTCSMNPLEDEAVIASILRSYPQVRLVEADVQKLLPGLKYRPGISSWQCDENIFTIGEGSEKDKQESIHRLPPITSSMHPPSEEECINMRLERCIRIFPHDQNTGGFFIALLEKGASTNHCIDQNTNPEKEKRLTKPTKSNTSQSKVNSLQVVKIKDSKKEKGGKVKAMQSLGYNAKDTIESSSGDPTAMLINRSSLCFDVDSNAFDKINCNMNCDVNLLAGQKIVFNSDNQTFYLATETALRFIAELSTTIPIIQFGLPVYFSSPDFSRRAMLKQHKDVSMSRHLLNDVLTPVSELQLPYLVYNEMIKSLLDKNIASSSVPIVPSNSNSSATPVDNIQDAYILMFMNTIKDGVQQETFSDVLHMSVYALLRDRREALEVYSTQLQDIPFLSNFDQLFSRYSDPSESSDYPVLTLAGGFPNHKAVQSDMEIISAGTGAGQKRRLSKAERKKAKKMKPTDSMDSDNRGNAEYFLEEDSIVKKDYSSSSFQGIDSGISSLCTLNMSILPVNHVESTVLLKHAYSSCQRRAMVVGRLSSPLSYLEAQLAYQNTIQKMLK